MLFANATRRLAVLSALFLFSAAASAQQITVTPGTVLTAGNTAKVTYSNPALANQTVTIEIGGGFPIPEFQTIKIRLDGTGKGSGDWTVANWGSACFSGPGAPPVIVPIQ